MNNLIAAKLVVPSMLIFLLLLILLITYVFKKSYDVSKPFSKTKNIQSSNRKGFS